MSERFLRFASVSTALLLAGATLTACGTEPPVENMSNAVANNMSTEREPPVEQPPAQVLDREALLVAAFRARSAAAIGADDRAVQRQLDRQRFAFRIRLGCNILAPGAPDEVEARYDPETRRVHLQAAPDISMESPLVTSIAGEGIEAVEGFWIRDPWILSPSCAGASSGSREFGIAQFFTEQDARTERREGRAYEIAAPLPEGAATPAAGSWDLVLTGRLRRWGNDRVILCRPERDGARPACIISVEFDAVSVEEVDSHRSLANWGRG